MHLENFAITLGGTKFQYSKLQFLIVNKTIVYCLKNVQDAFSKRRKKSKKYFFNIQETLKGAKKQIEPERLWVVVLSKKFESRFLPRQRNCSNFSTRQNSKEIIQQKLFFLFRKNTGKVERFNCVEVCHNACFFSFTPFLWRKAETRGRIWDGALAPRRRKKRDHMPMQTKTWREEL